MDIDKEYLKSIKMRYLIENALLNSKQTEIRNMIVEPADEKAYKELGKFKDEINTNLKTGRNLLICSDKNGNGKTLWAIKILMQYFENVWNKDFFINRGLFINASRLFQGMRNSYGSNDEYYSHIKKYVLDADIVVWDDIAIRGLKDDEHSMLYNFINERNDREKTNIYTTNAVGEKLREILGDRLYSRVVKGSQIVVLNGTDKRALN